MQTAATFSTNLNPQSLEIAAGARDSNRPSAAPPGDRRFQFERLGYFCVDPDSSGGKLVFNRIVTLKDSWAKAKETPMRGSGSSKR